MVSLPLQLCLFTVLVFLNCLNSISINAVIAKRNKTITYTQVPEVALVCLLTSVIFYPSTRVVATSSKGYLLYNA